MHIFTSWPGIYLNTAPSRRLLEPDLQSLMEVCHRLGAENKLEEVCAAWWERKILVLI